MQPCKTGDQPYSDASPNSECSLVTYFTLLVKSSLVKLKTQLYSDTTNPLQ